ncbi:TIGR04222 domain-containing membrane protein [Dactylosporangium sp. AC04546]|uniref:TIGR04222 domain-containing membrane protein n=1 Tax=Dactylosporangium sp. AC04546 TaxID=2862460 RepID=UPI001EDF8EFA|nr:TIGR04222 domain-containing membrane protein [Dactylosporangium sp. AC04546]WVK81860.1 TIGR04222 domain-containing membrane protein [Dactylosporangium sp. AC04546]
MELALSGEAFVWWYGLFACLAAAAVLLWRRPVTRGPEAGDPTPLELALLAGGSARAIAASLAALRVAHAVAADGLTLRRIGPAHDEATELDRAVLDAVGREVAPDEDPAVRRIVTAAGHSLAERGLLIDARARRRLREGAIPLGSLALLALLFVAVRLSYHHPVTLHLEAALAVAAGGGALLLVPRLPRRTRALLDRLRAEGGFLRDGWHTFGPPTAALAVAVHGPDVMASIDPAFAAAASRSTVDIPLDRPRPPEGEGAGPGFDPGPTGPVGWYFGDRE